MNLMIINITNQMTLDDIRCTPKYSVFNRLDYIKNIVAFDIEILEGIFKNTVISFKYNTLLLDLYKYSFNVVVYKGIKLSSPVLYEYELSNICSNVLLQTLV